MSSTAETKTCAVCGRAMTVSDRMLETLNRDGTCTSCRATLAERKRLMLAPKDAPTVITVLGGPATGKTFLVQRLCVGRDDAASFCERDLVACDDSVAATVAATEFALRLLAEGKTLVFADGVRPDARVLRASGITSHEITLRHSMPDVPPVGYRFLTYEESVEATDVVWGGEGWQPANASVVGCQVGWQHVKYARHVPVLLTGSENVTQESALASHDMETAPVGAHVRFSLKDDPRVINGVIMQREGPIILVETLDCPATEAWYVAHRLDAWSVEVPA